MTAQQTIPAGRGGIVGQPVSRVDGALKVSGRAPYAYEESDGGDPVYGFILGAAIARGKIAEMDVRQAAATPGVLLVMTHNNAPRQGAFEPEKVANVFARPRPELVSNEIHYYDQPIALVVATSFEGARSAAASIKVRYETKPGKFDLTAHLGEAYKPKIVNAGIETDTAHGDMEAAFAAAPVKLDQIYTCAYQSHVPMEPHACLAFWQGDELTVHTSTQSIGFCLSGLSATLTMPPEKIRVLSRYIGGGFGDKLIVHAETVLAALAAREVKRPVKLAFTRQQMFANTGHRPMFIQKVRLGANQDGRLTAIGHEVISQTAQYEEFAEQTAAFTRALYAAPNRVTRHRLVRLDMHRGEWMRAPGEAPGMLAIETAMDELAERLNLDPIELRIRNEPERDPELKVPFSKRNLIGCMREGARRFGWDKRNPKPGAVRDGRTLIGIGMAAAIRPNYMRPANAAVEIDRSGHVTARMNFTDIGTGAYTVMSQIVADTMGLPLDQVTVLLGDSRFPTTPGSVGSLGTGSVGTALYDACLALKAKIAETGFPSTAVPKLEATGKAEPTGDYKAYSQHTYGAHFAEVGVDMDTCEIRLRRMLGVFAAGRIFNPKTAHSQIIGGMIWGVGAALMEEAVVDSRFGHFVNHDLAEYHVPVHADIPNIDAVFLDEHDDKANPFGAKGIGELGICGSGAAVANAVYNATGVRSREFPITLDKLVPHLRI